LEQWAATSLRCGDCAYCQISAKLTPLRAGLGGAFGKAQPGAGGQASLIAQ